MDVYLETGARRVFASAVDWPGWARAGRDEESALHALIDYAPRYRRIVRSAPALPSDISELHIVERLKGDATTDFGAPGATPAHDGQRPDPDELKVLAGVMRACWKAFDRASRSATGKQLAPAGPRGGGRDLEAMIEHVAGAELGYLSSLGGRAERSASAEDVRAAFVEALGARARGELPDRGPRGGRRWPARYAARRAAWHVLDHAWELEDRLRAVESA
ncbi:hypothetical protein BH23CHL7_BH23CHL7_19440 [soil metagenome]